MATVLQARVQTEQPVTTDSSAPRKPHAPAEFVGEVSEVHVMMEMLVLWIPVMKTQGVPHHRRQETSATTEMPAPLEINATAEYVHLEVL